MPRVSVIIPMYSHWDFLPDTMLGLKRQTFRDFEVIAVVDGDGDGHEREIEDLSRQLGSEIVWHIMSKNGGTGSAINEGFKHCSGEYWTWIHDDNYMASPWLETLVGHLDNHPDCVMVYSQSIRIQGEMVDGKWVSRRSRVHRVPTWKPGLLIQRENCWIGPSFLFRRELYERTGGMRGKISHDYDWWLRAEETLKPGEVFSHIPKPLCDCRIHDRRAAVTRRHQYDADHWRKEAMKRRGIT